MHKIALLGCGRIGKIHAANAFAHPDLTLSHVVDPFADNAQAVAKSTGAAIATFEAVLADPGIEGVNVASSTDLHLDQCLAIHAAGKAIFCEKPIGMDLALVKSHATALKDARLFLAFNRRFDPHFRVLRERLVAGEVGALETLQITSHDTAPPPIAFVKTSGGLFRDMAIHDLDMARWLLGEEPSEIMAWGSCLVDPAIREAGDIDTARTMLRTASGKLCVISNTRRSGYGYDQRVEAFGAKGMLRIGNVTESTVQTLTEAGARDDRLQNFFLERYADAYRAEMAHFADILAGKARPLVGYDDGVAGLRLAEAAVESLNSGRPVLL
jgi:myo-inositol 2-dehydrogenase/D-chiro-inositol 1-dehydrogenase